MAAILRAVLDTNVVLAASRSPHAGSPGREILEHWRDGRLALLYSEDVLAEYAEKLLALGISEAETERLLRRFARHGIRVSIVFYHLRHYPHDGDDIIFLLCALNGTATHLVSYDADLLELGHRYREELSICKPLEFVAALRATGTPS